MTSSPPAIARPARAVLARDLAVTLLALALLLAWEWSGYDLAVERLYGTVRGFGWRDHWLTSQLLHQGGRALAWLVVTLLVVDALRPLVGDGPAPRERRYWLAVIVACSLLVPALKQLTLTSCPWDLSEFGGVAHYVSHWQWRTLDGGPGHCFPSGHAVAAFAFFGAYFGWRGARPGLARGWLLGVCALGLLFGWAQLARGAHYVSHTLWSGWLCWTLCVLATRLAPAWPAARRVTPANAPVG